MTNAYDFDAHCPNFKYVQRAAEMRREWGNKKWPLRVTVCFCACSEFTEFTRLV